MAKRRPEHASCRRDRSSGVPRRASSRRRLVRDLPSPLATCEERARSRRRPRFQLAGWATRYCLFTFSSPASAAPKASRYGHWHSLSWDRMQTQPWAHQRTPHNVAVLPASVAAPSSTTPDSAPASPLVCPPASVPASVSVPRAQADAATGISFGQRAGAPRLARDEVAEATVSLTCIAAVAGVVARVGRRIARIRQAARGQPVVAREGRRVLVVGASTGLAGPPGRDALEVRIAPIVDLEDQTRRRRVARLVRRRGAGLQVEARGQAEDQSEEAAIVFSWARQQHAPCPLRRGRDTGRFLLFLRDSAATA